MMKEYIERDLLNKWLLTECATLDTDEDKECVVERLESDIPAADVVPWECLERYAHGQRMNFASEFVANAREKYEEGIH